LRSLHSGLKNISDYIISNTMPGKTCKELFYLAWERARELKLESSFMNLGQKQNTSFIGHGVGLECNEPPMLAANDDSKLDAGYTLALDLHMLRDGVGVVKLEDTILITETGAEILTLSPRELFEVGG
ncbi:MAG: M24 family metallopeptidase, partial [Chloroflexi bacterium]|nr:M24 family metallopeptidase [Chloroflexota bacterium]